MAAQSVDPPTTASNPRCNICSSVQMQRVYNGWGFDYPGEHYAIIRCQTCDVAVTHPMLSAEQLTKYYNTSYYGGGKQQPASLQKFAPWIERLVRGGNRRRAMKLAKLMKPLKSDETPLRFLDVGCGRGGFLKEMARQGIACDGVDIAPFSEAETNALPFDFHQGSVEEQAFPDQSFDGASIWHVLEHLRDPKRTVQELARILKPGGVLSIAVPNFDSWQASVFGPNWFHLDLPRHLYHFGVASLRHVLRQEGFNVREETTLAWDQNVYGLIQSAQNALLPRPKSNRLYALLKHRGGDGFHAKREPLVLAGLGALGAALLPAAVAESVVSSLVGRGASVIFYAERV